MNSVVLDASFIVKLLVEEKGSKLAAAVLEGYEAQGSRIIAPAHAFAEVAEVLCRKQRRNLISSTQFERAIAAVTKGISSQSIDRLIAPSTQLAMTANISVYDALYVVLAEREEGVVLTADRKLTEALRHSVFVSLILCVDETSLIFYGEA